MKIVRRNETKKVQNGKECYVFEYPMGDKEINGAVIGITGRYPVKGRLVNEKVREMVYVIQGSGSITVEGKYIELQEGDLALIEAGEKYFWDGNLRMFVPCVPAWYPEQHKEVD